MLVLKIAHIKVAISRAGNEPWTLQQMSIRRYFAITAEKRGNCFADLCLIFTWTVTYCTEAESDMHISCSHFLFILLIHTSHSCLFTLLSHTLHSCLLLIRGRFTKHAVCCIISTWLQELRILKSFQRPAKGKRALLCWSKKAY